MLLLPPRDATMAPPIGTDLVPQVSVADRSRFDAIIILDGCLVRTVSGGVPTQSSLCLDRLSRTCVWQVAAAACSASSAWSVERVLVCRARPRSQQLFDEALRDAGLNGVWSHYGHIGLFGVFYFK